MGVDLFFDDRWRGAHGIARYASEMRRRTQLPYQALGWSGSPSSPGDAVRLERLRVPPSGLIYSPGYNGGLARCAQLLTVHDLIHLASSSPRARLNSLYYAQVLRRIIKRTGFVMTVSETSRDALQEWLRTDDVEVLVSGNGCSETFSHRAERLEPNEPDFFLYVGNLRVHKNAARAFEAVAKVANARLVVVNSDVSGFTELAATYGISSRVSVRAHVTDEELAGLYRRARGLLFPSIVEGFGLPVLEALSAGCPVVHLDECRSAREIGADFPGGSTGLADSTDEWADALRALLESRPTIPIMPTKYEWSSVAETLDRHVQRVAATHGIGA
ncbi:glycosyltransferase family 1 protein [Nocardioides sp. 616]|uniref:glycosyltransferase family 4 protein n=1 Tax=Nocardioides sp. 616 TaxID=2268090 RepID=UPI001F0538BD|nr:glycosyltransferase family 1 protein [Nocardioides sp. 616]